MKKKALSILLSAAMMLSLAACGGDAPQESSQDSSPASESGSESGSQESSQESGGQIPRRSPGMTRSRRRPLY